MHFDKGVTPKKIYFKNFLLIDSTKLIETDITSLSDKPINNPKKPPTDIIRSSNRNKRRSSVPVIEYFSPFSLKVVLSPPCLVSTI